MSKYSAYGMRIDAVDEAFGEDTFSVVRGSGLKEVTLGRVKREDTDTWTILWPEHNAGLVTGTRYTPAWEIILKRFSNEP